MSTEYNYQSFRPEYYNFDSFNGPKAGESVVDFTATDLEGSRKRLSDFFGKWVVLETGSITCPIYESKIRSMNKFVDQFPDVEFLLLYVREAHPGEKINQHRILEEKMSCARRAKDEDGDKRTILVDDLEGSAHQKYGGMPNSVYIINPSGKIVFRGDWNDTKMVEKVLKERDSDKIYNKDRFSARPNFTGPSFSVLFRAGRKAVFDFIKAFPKMVIKHLKKPH